MEKGTGSEEDQPRENNDNAHDGLRDMASINEEDLIANRSADYSDSSVTSNNTTSSSIVNTDKLSPNNSENKSKCKILCKNSLTCSGDCNGNGLTRKFSHECENYTSDKVLPTLEESHFSQADINDSESRKNKSNPFSQHHISNCSLDESNDSAACEVLGNENEIYNVQGNKNVLMSNEHKKDELEHKNVHESHNVNELVTVLDDNKNDKKCSVAAEQIKDETKIFHSVIGASEFPLQATSIVASGSQMSVNSDSHEGKPSTDLACPLELTAVSAKYSCSNNNNNILSSSSSNFTWTSESDCQQQMNFNTTSLNGTSPGFTNANMAAFQSNTGKTKVSFSFPLNNGSNFNFGMNDAFSNMPASKNSFQIKEHGTDTNKSITSISSVSSSTSSCKTSLAFLERQADIFKSSPNSQISTVPMFQTPHNSNTFIFNSPSIKCSLPSIKSTSFGMSTACASKSPLSEGTPKGPNSQTSGNSGTLSFMPSSSDFKILFKPQSSVAQITESSDTKNTSSSIGSSTSFPGCAKNLFPKIVTNVTSFQSSSRPTSDVKNVETFISLENKVPAFSFGSPNGTSSSIFPVSQQSPSFIKSPTYLSTSTLKLDRNKTFQSSLFGSSSSMDNTQTTMTTCSELCNLFGRNSTTPLFSKCSTASLFDTSAKSPFGSLVCSPKVESSQESFSTLFQSKASTSSGLSKSEMPANEKPYFNFGCMSKQSDTEQFLLECNTPLKSNQVNTSNTLFSPSLNPISIKLTPNIVGFNFRTSSTGTRKNFNFGSSSVTPRDSPFVFKSSEKGKRSKPRSHKKIAQSKSNFNNNPEIPKIPFRIVKDDDCYVKHGVVQTIKVNYHCITIMPEYSSFSFEELRFQYDKYNSKPLLPTETYTSTMINKTTQTSETMLDHLIDIWKVLECPVCLEIVIPPIQQCEQGHHVCNNCWQKIVCCPLCKRYRKQTRNYMAEEMLEKLPLPCKYRMDGCMMTVQQKEKTAHEAKCIFRTYNCLVQDCNKIHNYKDMVVHLKSAHGHLMTSNEGSCHPASWTLTKYNFQKLVHVFEIPYWGLFFLRHRKPGQNNYLWMQMINVDTGTSGKEFFYSVEVGDVKDLRSVSYKGPIFPVYATIDITQDCLIISEDLLSSLKKDHILHVKISIWKKQP